MSTYLARDSSLTEPEPVRNIASLSSAATAPTRDLRASRPPLTRDLRAGSASAAASAPIAMDLATSRPLLIPPDAIMTPLVAERASIIEAAVGIPQSLKASPNLALLSSPDLEALIDSILAQLVPPTPATLNPLTPIESSSATTSIESPEPTSLTMTGTPTFSTTSAILSRSPLYFGSPSGWIASWSGFRCIASASALTMSTHALAPSTPTSASCWAPMFAYTRMSGATSRTTLNVDLRPLSSSAARWLPTPMPKPNSAATDARSLFNFAPLSEPPVMLSIIMGSRSLFPNSSVDVSTSSRSSSGRALCTRWTCSSHVVWEAASTSSEAAMSKCSSFLLVTSAMAIPH